MGQKLITTGSLNGNSSVDHNMAVEGNINVNLILKINLNPLCAVIDCVSYEKKLCHYKLSTFSQPGDLADNVLGETESEETDLDKTLIIGVFLVLVCLAGLLCVLVQSFIKWRKKTLEKERTNSSDDEFHHNKVEAVSVP